MKMEDKFSWLIAWPEAILLNDRQDWQKQTFGKFTEEEGSLLRTYGTAWKRGQEYPTGLIVFGMMWNYWNVFGCGQRKTHRCMRVGIHACAQTTITTESKAACHTTYLYLVFHPTWFFHKEHASFIRKYKWDSELICVHTANFIKAHCKRCHMLKLAVPQYCANPSVICLHNLTLKQCTTPLYAHMHS